MDVPLEMHIEKKKKGQAFKLDRSEERT